MELSGIGINKMRFEWNWNQQNGIDQMELSGIGINKMELSGIGINKMELTPCLIAVLQYNQ